MELSQNEPEPIVLTQREVMRVSLWVVNAMSTVVVQAESASSSSAQNCIGDAAAAEPPVPFPEKENAGMPSSPKFWDPSEPAGILFSFF
jgi:hypothetical protein